MRLSASTAGISLCESNSVGFVDGNSVTVVIPTFNRAGPLRRALASVVAQTRPPDEIIVVDDGSTDDTARLVSEDFEGVRYLVQDRAGVSAARNRGIAEARGRWIAFLDSDDEWQPSKLERQLAALVIESTYRICHTEEIWIRRGRRVNPKHRHAKAGGFIFRRCLPLCAMSPSSVIMHRSLIEEIGPFDEDLPVCEDYDMWLRVCSRYPVLFVPQPLVIKYGGHDDQLSRRYWGMDRFRIRALEKVIEQPHLSEGDRLAALDTLINKTGIYAQGARKRGREAEATAYERRALLYEKRMRMPLEGAAKRCRSTG
jgi:glycosyltransferase involved in cell wall biosynthesis